MEIKLSCPLGHQCEIAKDGAIHRCAWYVQLRGNHPQTGEDVDEWGCAMAWTPVLLVENARTNRGQTAAIESFRNEVVKNNVQQLYSLTHSHVPLPLNIADEGTP